MEYDQKRMAVFGYRLMFSPETQPIKQTVIAQIVFTTLAESPNSNGESIGKLTAFGINGIKALNFSIHETRAALAGLVTEGLVEELVSRKKRRWRITTIGRKKITDDTAAANQRISSVIDSFFGPCTPITQYKSAFLECLGNIFDRFAQRYIDAFLLESGATHAFNDDDIDAIANETIGRYTDLSPEEFRSRLRRFLGEQHPDGDWLKWTYCKNYYSVRIIGAGAQADALSAEVFSGMTAYLDTNVLIGALDTSSSTHEAVNQVLSRFSQLGCSVAVLRVTIRELQDLARNQGEKLDAVLRQIPDALLDKTRGLIARTEASHRKDPSCPSPSEVLSDFENVDNLVADRLSIDVIDDDWFKSARDSQDMVDLANELRTHYNQSAPFRRHKTDHAAKHDALALHWVCKARMSGENCAFVTLDTSLPTFPLSSNGSSGIRFRTAITVDALLPWLGMMSQDDEGVSKAYTALLTNRLVPIRQAFDIQEFRMLAEIGMDCRHMPSKDVEQCLLYLRHEAKDADMRKAEDRERMHHKVKSFFSSPDRKYLSTISSLQEAVSEKDKKLEKVTRDKKEEAVRFQEEISKYRHEVLVRKTKQRLTAVGAVFVVAILVSTWLSADFGAGENLVQRIGNTWWLFGLVVTGCAGLARILCPGEMWSEAKRIVFSLVGR